MSPPPDDNPSAKQPSPPPRKASARRLGIAFVGLILLSALGAGLLLFSHRHRLRVEARARAQDVGRGPRLFVTKVALTPATRDLTLPADVRGFFQSTVYAKVSGYVKSMAVDKGDTVKKGRLLGVIESPEVDQQVAAAQADLVIKRRTFERYRQLVTKDFVSRQDFETARAQYDISQATLRQTRALQGYEVLRAPFAGTVTARYVDPGALVPAATGSTQGAAPLVDIADLARLRVLVFVQQDAAPLLHVGDPVLITVDQRPEIKIDAPITRFARAIDPRSRTMLCEIWLDNIYGLYPGTFVHVTLHLTGPRLPMIPSTALQLHDNKPSVALIRDSRVQFVAVRPGFDDGKTVQILEGLQPGQQVALAAPAEIADGAVVQPIERREPPPGGAPAGGAPSGGGSPPANRGAPPPRKRR
jgi:RND family efflux transporter MFP subunit